jgi:hypothetical protein
MSDPEYMVILYSKYSYHCKKILQVYNPELMNYFKLVCIDSSVIRSRLAKSKSIQITTVPSVLLVYPGNKVERFEGDGVTDWILRQIAQNLPPSETLLESSENPMYEPVDSVAPSSTNPSSIPQKTSIDMLDDDEFVQEEKRPSKSTAPKSIVELAADMQAERPDLDAEANRRKKGQFELPS